MTDGWKELQDANAISLGDGEGQHKQAGGLLVNILTDVGENHAIIYELVQKDGVVLPVWGSAAIDRQVGPHHIGKFIKMVFKGREPTSRGQDFKVIKTSIWDAPLNDDMLNWPRVGEFYTPAPVDNDYANETDDPSTEADLPF